MRPAAVAGLASIRMKANTQGLVPLLTQACIVPLLPDYQAPEFEIVALYPHRRHLTAKVRAFLDMLVDEFAQQQRWPGTSSAS